jgi:predicted RNase H-like nuclease (RuvC/YqgF family)
MNRIPIQKRDFSGTPTQQVARMRKTQDAICREINTLSEYVRERKRINASIEKDLDGMNYQDAQELTYKKRMNQIELDQTIDKLITMNGVVNDILVTNPNLWL